MVREFFIKNVLGTSRFQTYWRITLPLSVPGVLVGGVSHRPTHAGGLYNAADSRRLQGGTPFVQVTHDQEEVMSIADVIAVMNNGEIEDPGLPKRVCLKSRSLFTATFMGASNIIEGRVVEPLVKN